MNYDEILCKRIQEVKPSGIRRFFDILEEMKDAISLGIGEPDFVTPWQIREAGIRSIRRGYTQYTGNRGLPALRERIARYMEERFGAAYPPEHIIVTVGASEGIDLVMRAVCEAGDEILIPDPGYVSYVPCVQLAGGTPVTVRCVKENGFILTPEALEGAITPRTKALLLPYPNNPTGGIMTRAQLEALVPVIEKHDLLVISDEIYAELTYGQHHVSPANLTELYDRTVLVNGFSKSHAMTGWRMGYVCGPAPVIQQMLKLHQFGIMSAPTTSQYAAIEAMRNGDGDIEHMREEYDSRRRYLVENLNRIGLTCFEPKGAFYVFPCIKSSGLSSQEFCERFLREEKVAVIPGDAFGPGGEGYVRACYAASMRDLSEALERLERFLKRLRAQQ